MRLVRLLALALALPVLVNAQTVLCYHDVRDDVGSAPLGSGEIFVGTSHLDPDQFAISTRNLASQFDWLRSHNYHVISLEQLIDARSKNKSLPGNDVVLTFDDGLQSIYTKVFPLLKAYHYPALVAVVGAWTDLPPEGKVDYGYREFTRQDFVTWRELREMQSSGLVEVASHTWNLHKGIVSNPQGSLIPAVIAHAYDLKTQNYETDAEYAARIRADLLHSSQEIKAELGRAPRAIMWPYGAHTQAAESIAASLGMTVSFTLGLPITFPNRPSGPTGLMGIPRLVLMSNPAVPDMVWSLRHLHLSSNVRAIQVDLDYVYDADPAQQERNIDMLLDRIKKIRATQVWLQAFADPDGTGAPKSVYFPNRIFPIREDLFSRVAWQLRTRCGVEVYAWMPVLAWRLPDKSMQERLSILPQKGYPIESPVRLNPFLPETQTIVREVYEDLGRAAPVSGILFSDDAILRDSDALGSNAPPPGPKRTLALIQFTQELSAAVREWNPELATVRNLFAEPVIHPAAEAWYAQSLPAFLSNYDMVALMAMPELENARRPESWLRSLVSKVAAVPGGEQKTVFELQSVDWRTKRAIDAKKFIKQMRLLQKKGALHLAYYPDDFAKNVPSIDRLIPVFSASPYPGLQ